MITETKDGAPAVHAASPAEWRSWLAANCETEREVWLIMYGKGSGVPSLSHQDTVAHALCYGWIDSKSIKRDEHSRYQRFTPRNPKSNWSSINKELAERLIADGLMTPQGQAMIDVAKQTGTWDALADAQRGIVPDDLQAALDANPAARENFTGFSPSSRRRILEWIMTAKRPETRSKRIAQTVDLAAQNLKANH